MLADHLFTTLDDEVKRFPLVQYSDREKFKRYLCLIHQIIAASEEMLEEAIKVDSPCRDYFVAHLEEERDHEKWLAKDIERLGGPAAGLEYLSAAFAGAQYYLIKHVSPLALLGYMALLEGYPASDELIKALEALYPDSVSTLKYHAVHDREHRAELIKQLNLVSEEFHDLIIWNATQSARLFGHLLSNL